MPFVLLWDNQFSKEPVKQPLTDFTEKFIIQEKSNYKKENVHMTYTVGQMAKRPSSLCGTFFRRYPDVSGERLRMAADHRMSEKSRNVNQRYQKIHCPSATGRFHNSGTFRVIPAPAHRPAGADGFPAADT